MIGNIHEIGKKDRPEGAAGRIGAAIAIGAAILAAYFTGLIGSHPKPASEPVSANVKNKAETSETLDLTEKQVGSLLASGGAAQKDVEQAVSDQQTAEGALRAARNAVRVWQDGSGNR
jgi:hypothetical protein